MYKLPPSPPNDPLAEAFRQTHEDTEMPEEALQRLLAELRENLIRLDGLNPQTEQEEVAHTVQAIKDIHEQFGSQISFEMLIDAALSHGEKDKAIEKLNMLIENYSDCVLSLRQQLQTAEDADFNWKHLAAGGAGGYSLYNGYVALIDALTVGVYTGDPATDAIRGVLYGAAGAGLLKAFQNARDNSPPEYEHTIGRKYFEYGSAGLFAGVAMAFVDKTL